MEILKSLIILGSSRKAMNEKLFSIKNNIAGAVQVLGLKKQEIKQQNGNVTS